MHTTAQNHSINTNHNTHNTADSQLQPVISPII